MTRARLAEFFGGKIRFGILESLVEVDQPMTAYQIAILKGLDPAATYRYLTEFADLGIVNPRIKGRKQTTYQLSDNAGRALVAFLRSLKEETSKPVPIDLEAWTSPEIQAERTSKIVGLSDEITKLPLRITPKDIQVEDLLSRRASGELSALIRSSQIVFNELFERKGNTFILKDV
jgi:hypothetical protein